MTRERSPEPGVPAKLANGSVIIPSYVRLSNAPLPTGACQTSPCTDPAGWYVEYRYEGHKQHLRSFFSFDEVQPSTVPACPETL